MLPHPPLPLRYVPIVCLALLTALLAPASAAAAAQQGETWRSRLYPQNWRPGFTDEHGLFLHDFSYAGYAMGQRPIPDEPDLPVFDVTAPDFGADPTGERDSTAAIQKAIDRAAERGGGIVHLPEGTYRIQPPADARQALLIGHSRIILRGDGPGRTFLYNTEPVMHRRAVIRAAPGGAHASWTRALRGSTIALAEDAPNQAMAVKVQSVAGIEPGDWIVLRADATEDFVRAIDPQFVDDWPGRLPGLMFYRQVRAVDADSSRITLDIPLRYPVKRRDHARLYRVRPHLSEVGIEAMSIGMREHPGGDFGFNAYQREGTAAHDVHASYLIVLNHVVDGWVRRVHTYRPANNAGPHHMVSNGIQLLFARNVTIEGCDLRHAQYRGGGGNGYGYVFQGSDNLITRCTGRELRYVYDFKSMQTTGNVVHRSESHGISDFHMHLSVTNLLDDLHMVGSHFNAAHRRRWGTIPHGRTTDQSVFWNLRGSGGRGHVLHVDNQPDAVLIIGTSGQRHSVRGLPAQQRHRLEGEARGEHLQPRSLYEDQLHRRLQRSGGNRTDQ